MKKSNIGSFDILTRQPLNAAEKISPSDKNGLKQ